MTGLVRTLIVLAVATAGLAAPLAAAQSPLDDERVLDRLRRLDPSAPMDYFRLGEEVAYEHPGAAGAELARRLYLIAMRLDRQRADGDLVPSVCLALADIERDADQRAWLLAMAESEGAGRRRLQWRTDPDRTLDDGTGLAAAEALALYRAEEHRRAADRLERPGARRAIRAADDALPFGAEAVFDQVASDGGCPECGNRRVVQSKNDPTRLTLCYTCGGRLGPELDAEQVQRFWAVERYLIGDDRRWSTSVAMGGAAPLREFTPEALAQRYRVDTSKTIFEGGEWVEPPAAR